MRILVTGGAGFIGSHLCDRLLLEKHEVIVVDNLITGSLDNIDHLAGREDFHFIKHDVSNFMYISGNVDLVMHLASPASPNPNSPFGYPQLPIQTLKVGALGTHNALGVARAALELTREMKKTVAAFPGLKEIRVDFMPVTLF